MSDCSLIADTSSFAFFSNEDMDEDKETIEKCFFYTKVPELPEEKDQHNVTSFTESDLQLSDEKKEDKTNDDLNETSMTIKAEDLAEDSVDYEKLQPSNNIFTIFKKKRSPKHNQKPKRPKRKFDADTMRRKIKPSFHKYIFDSLNKCIKAKSKRLKMQNIHTKLLKMNNRITSTVSIEFNKALLNNSIGTMIETEPISSKYKVYSKESNAALVAFLRGINDEEINSILNQSYTETYYDYLKSAAYKQLLRKIKNKDGEDYMNKFKGISEEFINYFLFTDPKHDKVVIKSSKRHIVAYSRDTSFNSVSDIVVNDNDNKETIMDMNFAEEKDVTHKGEERDFLMMLDLD